MESQNETWRSLDYAEHEPAGGLLGHRTDGELLRPLAEGTGPRRGHCHTGRGPGGDRRIHRGLLQHESPTLVAGVRAFVNDFDANPENALPTLDIHSTAMYHPGMKLTKDLVAASAVPLILS